MQAVSERVELHWHQLSVDRPWKQVDQSLVRASVNRILSFVNGKLKSMDRNVLVPRKSTEEGTKMKILGCNDYKLLIGTSSHGHS